MADKSYLKDLIKKAKESKKEAEEDKGFDFDFKPEDKKVMKEAEQKLAQAVALPKPIAGPKQVSRTTSFPSQGEVEKSEFEKKLEAAEKKQIAQYGDTTIFKLKDNPQLLYSVPVPRPTAQEKQIINTIKEAATRLITISPYRIRDLEQRRNVYYQRVLDILRASPELGIPERRFEFYADAVVREMVGYGLIDQLVRDDQLEEIMIIGPQKPVYVFHRSYEMMLTNIEFYSDSEIEDLINKIAREIGRRVDISAPLLDARLPDGSRVNATISPASVSGATLTIRKFRADPYSLVDLINYNTLNPEAAAFLWLMVEGLGVKPANVLISGGTGSGKTTLLNVMASLVPPQERIVSIEDTAELSLPLLHWIRLEARPPGMEGRGEITLDVLTKNSLRMRPDRVIVGEVRHDEAFTLFTAMNTGHDGALNADALVQFSDGRARSIGEFAETIFSQNNSKSENGFEFAEVRGISVKSLNKQSLKAEDKSVSRVWRKKTKQSMLEIRTKSGKRVTTTLDHPFYKISSGIAESNAGQLKAGDWIALPNGIDVASCQKAENAYLAGLVLGDGHLRKEKVEFVNGEPALAEAFAASLRSLSSNRVSVSEKSGYMRMKLYDVQLCRKLHEEFGIPFGDKTKIFEVPEKILTADSASVGAFVRGLFDCEAHVNAETRAIEFSTSNPKLARTLPLLLLRFGIFSRTSKQLKDGKGNEGPYFKISIYGRENLGRFADGVGFGHPKKAERLAAIFTLAGSEVDLVPNIGSLLAKARLENLLSQEALSKLCGIKTRSTVRAIETGERKPNKQTLLKLLAQLKGEIAFQLRMLAEADIFWDKIVSVSSIEHDGFVYDLTVDDNHSYMANGVWVSNCMGTIHANSAQETIVRVTSPPMNVPQLMLAGLDFVIIEHRLHDRKKGTIRRITEIAEVSGVLEGKPTTTPVFQRDPVKDTLERTGAACKYLNALGDYTGLNKKQMESIISGREKFLEELVKKNTRATGELAKACQDYLASKSD
ncbi:MAG: ATPase, T2SS/T4P/T4SS family [Candidatus Diapherotrites archaeon]